MKKEFIPYEETSSLIALGFKEPVIAHRKDGLNICLLEHPEVLLTDLSMILYQQAFRWFREEHGICGYVRRGSKIRFYYPPENGFTVDDYWDFHVYKTDGEHLPGHGMKDTYEEAELACLRKLIEIVNQNKDE